MAELTVSVRDLASFCHRSGDIDYRFRPSPTGLQGIEGHQRVYRGRPASYLREYPIEYLAGNQLLVRGRADGYDPASGVVEEIKTCRVRAETIPESVTALHMAQARLYGAMIAAREGCERLKVRLTWFNIDENREVSLEQDYSAAELAAFLAESLGKFSRWLEAVVQLRRNRDASLLALKFPHREFREGQRDIAELVYKCIDQSGQLLLEAPTGIGKTAAVLFPALKALGQGKHDKIAFLTARTVGRKSAEETLSLFHAAGYRGNALSISARDSICLSPGKACHGEDCPYARDYYDKLPRAMFAALEMPVLRRAELEDLARRFEVCPYQLSLDLQPWIDVVIGDVHHMYGLSALLEAQIDGGAERWSVLLDEAHNLPSRARGMFSASLAKKDLMAARSQADRGMVKSLDKINRVLLALQKEAWSEADFDSRRQVPAKLHDALVHFVTDCGERQAREAAFLHRQPLLLDFYFAVLQFLRVVDIWGDDFRFELARSDAKQSLTLRLNCLDPARLLAAKQQRLHALTAFSATLAPADWIRSSLGLGDEVVYRRQGSPFSASQMTVSVATWVDTRYRAREQSLGDLVRLLGQWLGEVSGNCIVYFPSYRYMQDALTPLLADGGLARRRSVWVQERCQGEAERAELLAKLASERDVAAFCILGGVFGEGIDLPGERLSSVVIVGVGLPQVNRDTEQLREHFAAKYGRGFDFAYLYPGMQKVDQALGRVIRTLNDRGTALIIDQRYAYREYRALLPRWWTYTDHPVLHRERASRPVKK